MEKGPFGYILSLTDFVLAVTVRDSPLVENVFFFLKHQSYSGVHRRQSDHSAMTCLLTQKKKNNKVEVGMRKHRE